LEFLLLAAGMMVVGVIIVVARNRRPTGMDASIDHFERRLDAIAPHARRLPGAAKRPGRSAPSRAGDRAREQRAQRAG
jgi:hypothetical protein